jgi:cyanophycinase
LVVIGGGNIPHSITSEILGLANGTASKIIVCPLASAFEGTGKLVADELFSKRHGCPNVEIFDFERPLDATQNIEKTNIERMRAFANSKEACQIFEVCDVFFFTGGDQRVLLRALKGTEFEKSLYQAWSKGKIVVAGTSAGLQVMSEFALTGDFYDVPADTTEDAPETRYGKIACKSVETVAGFGLVKKVIFDQHFIVRQRQNRLISAVLDRPGCIGLGVDEGTALVFQGQSETYTRPRVVGDGGVFYVDSSRARVGMSKNGSLNVVSDLHCGLVFEGASFPIPVQLG